MSESESYSDSDPSEHLEEPPQKLTKTTVNAEKEKKWTTKMMIKDALTELKTRKGVSVYAIKKHLTDKFQVNTDKLSYVIKKTLKTGVEDGTFIQLKGIGASGSFKLAVVKEKVKKTIKKKKPEKTGKEMKELKKKIDKADDANKKPPERKAAPKKMQKNMDVGAEKQNLKETKKTKEKAKQKTVETKNKETLKKSKVSKKMVEEIVKEKKTKAKMTKNIGTPAKKKTNMMKRKSIGSIIKPPKMKPK